eukprot:4592096-Alexandrium_andersonii.AAC.1
MMTQCGARCWPIRIRPRPCEGTAPVACHESRMSCDFRRRLQACLVQAVHVGILAPRRFHCPR